MIYKKIKNNVKKKTHHTKKSLLVLFKISIIIQKVSSLNPVEFTPFSLQWDY